MGDANAILDSTGSTVDVPNAHLTLVGTASAISVLTSNPIAKMGRHGTATNANVLTDRPKLYSVDAQECVGQTKFLHPTISVNVSMDSSKTTLESVSKHVKMDMIT